MGRRVGLTFSDYDLGPWQKLWEGRDSELMQLLEDVVSGRSFFDRDANLLLEIAEALRLDLIGRQLLFPIVATALLMLMLRMLTDETEHRQLIHTLLMASMAVNLSLPILQCWQEAQQAVETVLSFMMMALPVFSAAVAAVGQLAAASGLVPAMLGTLAFIIPVVQQGVLPLCRGMLLLNVINSLHTEQALSGLAQWLRTAVQWVLGLVMTVMIGILSVQGAAIMAFDTVSLKTARYTVATMLPVAGGMFAEMVGSLMTGAVLVKSALGTAGLLGVVMVCFGPVARMLLTGLALQLSAAIVQLVGEKSLAQAVSQMAHGVNTLLAVLLLTLAMACIMLTMVMNLGVV